jgi:hypothetical protein
LWLIKKKEKRKKEKKRPSKKKKRKVKMDISVTLPVRHYSNLIHRSLFYKISSSQAKLFFFFLLLDKNKNGFKRFYSSTQISSITSE